MVIEGLSTFKVGIERVNKVNKSIDYEHTLVNGSCPFITGTVSYSITIDGEEYYCSDIKEGNSCYYFKTSAFNLPDGVEEVLDIDLIK